MSPRLEMTEICDRVLRAGGPALLFERPAGHDIPVLANLFGAVRRVAAAMGVAAEGENPGALREIGKMLAFLREPEPPKGLRDLWEKFPVWKQLLNMPPKLLSSGPSQEIVLENAQVDLARLPVQTCWPEDAGPLITWGLTVTRGPAKARQNLGIYRQQVIGRNRVIMRWLAHRGGALDFRDHLASFKGSLSGRGRARRRPGDDAGGGGADPGCAVRVPVRRPAARRAHRARQVHWQHSGGARDGGDRPGRRDRRMKLREEGPHGDHTGYYNEVERFPVMTVRADHDAPLAPLSLDLHRQAARRAGDAGRSTERGFRTLVAKAVPGDRRLLPAARGLLVPPGGGQHEEAVSRPRQARDVRQSGAILRQFMYTKFIVVCDDDVDVRDWKEVVWALTTRVDPARDTTLVENTPIDYLDFASPVSGLGSKMGIDATNKWPGETGRRWGRPIVMDDAVKRRVDRLWQDLGI